MQSKIRQRRILVLVLPEVHLLDLAGPTQVFDEARSLGGRYEIEFVGVEPCSRSAQGLVLSELKPLPVVRSGDRVLVPGIESSTLDQLSHVPVAWLRAAHAAGAELCSICSGSFVLVLRLHVRQRLNHSALACGLDPFRKAKR